MCEYEHNFQNGDSSCGYARRSVSSLEGEFGRCVKFAKGSYWEGSSRVGRPRGPPRHKGLSLNRNG